MDFSLQQAMGFLISFVVCILIIFAFGSLISSTGMQSVDHTFADNSFFKSDINEQILSSNHPVLTVDEIHLDLNQKDFVYANLKNKAHAMDPIDGDISNKILIKGEVDITEAGTYPVRFTVENSLGLKTSYIKKVLID